MTVHLDHLMVPSRNKAASAKLLAELLGVPWSESGVGPFAAVYVNDGLTIDFDEWTDPFPTIHYCFRVSQADFNTINGLPGRVKVVNQINWCGGLKPNVIGCAPVPGNSQIVVRFIANQEGILWAHEYGHTRGLNHVAGATSIMNGTISTTHTTLTQNEGDSFDN